MDLRTQHAVPHQEVQLNPAIAPRRYRHWLRIPPTPSSEPANEDIASRWRWCQADLHSDPIDDSRQRFGPAGAAERNRALRSVVNRDKHSEPPSVNAANLHT